MPRQRLPSEVPRSGTKAGAPWWMYALAACFLGHVALSDYSNFWGPERVGVDLVHGESGALVERLTPDLPGERAGLQPGDRILAVDGMVVRHAFEWNVIGANFEIGRLHRVEIARGGERRVLDLKLGGQRGLRSRWSLEDTILSWWLVVMQGALLGLAFLIAFRRPQELVARVGALFLVTLPVGMSYFSPPYGFAAAWRDLPAPLGWLLWIPQALGLVSGPLAFTFFAVFPRTLFRARWAWALVWLLVPTALPMLALFVYMVYRPQHAAGLMPVWYWQWMGVVAVLYTLTALGFLVVNYRRLEDLNERRRVRVLVAGTVVGFLGCVPVFIAILWGGSFPATLVPSLIPLLGLLLFLLFPASFAYAILRHRVFDIGVMVRQGLPAPAPSPGPAPPSGRVRCSPGASPPSLNTCPRPRRAGRSSSPAPWPSNPLRGRTPPGNFSLPSSRPSPSAVPTFSDGGTSPNWGQTAATPC